MHAVRYYGKEVGRDVEMLDSDDLAERVLMESMDRKLGQCVSVCAAARVGR